MGVKMVPSLWSIMVQPLIWQSPRGKRVVTHWASMLRCILLISECNLTTRDSRKRTPMGGPPMRERRGSGPEKRQQPKNNPWRPVGIRHLLTVCLTKVHMIGWNPNGIQTRSMENIRWYNPSQVLTAKHVSYQQLTAKINALGGLEKITKIKVPLQEKNIKRHSHGKILVYP